MNSPRRGLDFYTTVLWRSATACGLKLTVTVDEDPLGGTTMWEANETNITLRKQVHPAHPSIRRGGRS